MPHPQYSVEVPAEMVPLHRAVDSFGISAKLLKTSRSTRLDASYFNPAVARALETLRHSGMSLVPLGEITESVFIPNRFKRIYVEREYGIPFLQGSHVVHFQPANIKYVSRTAHKNLERWIIREGWILITRSGTVGRVALCPPEWDNWAASEHILRVIPNEEVCSAGYLYSFLASPLGHIQLTAQIYGAVVDELTEEQTRSVMVPMPQTTEQGEMVNRIDGIARRAVRARSKAVGLIDSAAAEVSDLVQGDKEDMLIASERLRELKENPASGASGEELEKELKRLEA